MTDQKSVNVGKEHSGVVATESPRPAHQGLSVGFTGTRHGMTEPQRAAVSAFLDEHKPTETHSGDCKGADSEFLDAALLCNGNEPPYTHGHPCDIKRWRAYRKYNSLHPVRAPAIRNQDIVDASDELLAAPKSTECEPRSGTWQTITMASKAKKTITIIWPDGTLQVQGYTSLAEIFGMDSINAPERDVEN